VEGNQGLVSLHSAYGLNSASADNLDTDLFIPRRSLHSESQAATSDNGLGNISGTRVPSCSQYAFSNATLCGIVPNMYLSSHPASEIVGSEAVRMNILPNTPATDIARYAPSDPALFGMTPNVYLSLNAGSEHAGNSTSPISVPPQTIAEDLWNTSILEPSLSEGCDGPTDCSSGAQAGLKPPSETALDLHGIYERTGNSDLCGQVSIAHDDGGIDLDDLHTLFLSRSNEWYFSEQFSDKEFVHPSAGRQDVACRMSPSDPEEPNNNDFNSYFNSLGQYTIGNEGGEADVDSLLFGDRNDFMSSGLQTNDSVVDPSLVFAAAW
jgi:hypothetical protein